MLVAILVCTLLQVDSDPPPFALDSIVKCPTCDAMTARIEVLESRLARLMLARSSEPVRRVRLIPISSDAELQVMTSQPAAASQAACYAPQAAPPVTYSAPPVTYAAPQASCYSQQAAPAVTYALPATPTVTYSAPMVAYSSPQVFAAASAQSMAFERRAIFGLGRQRFAASPSGMSFQRRGLFSRSSFSACGPGGCP